MKTRATVLFTLMVILFSGCVVKSLHQFYQEEDVIYDETLLGSWIDGDSARWVIKQYTFSKGFMKDDSTDNSYLVELYEDDHEPQKFNAHLFKLDGYLYFDFKPVRDDRDEGFIDLHLISAHSLGLVEISDQDNISIGWFEEEWLGKLFEENRVKISHEVINGATGDYGKEYVLTASTDELQKFISKYGKPDENELCKEDENVLCVQLTRDVQINDE